MYDKSLVIELLEQISNATDVVSQRFEVVDSSDFFLDTPAGMEKLDAQEIYYVCNEKLPTLHITINKMLSDLR